MGKLFGIISIVVALWATAEVFTKGVDGAFGGILASDDTVSSAEVRTTPQRFGDAARTAQEAGNARRNAIMPD